MTYYFDSPPSFFVGKEKMFQKYYVLLGQKTV